VARLFHLCLVCCLSQVWPAIDCRIYYGRQNTQHTHKSNHNIVAIYTQGNQNTTKQQQAMGPGSGQFNRLIDLLELIALFTA
jgi:hypothetical protein